MADDEQNEDERVPTFSEALAEVARKSGLGELKPGEAPNGRALIGAIGGVRGILESVLPGIAFLVIYLVTKNITWSVVVPVAIALVFVVARAGARSSMSSAIAGAVFLAFTAVLTLTTHDAKNNFVFGMVVNAVSFVVILVSLLIRWPLVGVIVGALFGDGTAWRDNAVKVRGFVIASWIWVAMFALRLALELPLYFLNNVPALSVVRLVTSVPLYALCLWVTWIIVRGTYAAAGASTPDAEA